MLWELFASWGEFLVSQGHALYLRWLLVLGEFWLSRPSQHLNACLESVSYTFGVLVAFATVLLMVWKAHSVSVKFPVQVRMAFH